MTGNAGYQLNAALVQEMTLQSSGISAEGNAEGVLINMIPKEGGNTFSGQRRRPVHEPAPRAATT